MGPAARSLRFRLFAFLAIACAMLAVALSSGDPMLFWVATTGVAVGNIYMWRSGYAVSRLRTAILLLLVIILLVYLGRDMIFTRTGDQVLLARYLVFGLVVSSFDMRTRRNVLGTLVLTGMLFILLSPMAFGLWFPLLLGGFALLALAAAATGYVDEQSSQVTVVNGGRRFASARAWAGMGAAFMLFVVVLFLFTPRFGLGNLTRTSWLPSRIDLTAGGPGDLPSRPSASVSPMILASRQLFSGQDGRYVTLGYSGADGDTPLMYVRSRVASYWRGAVLDEYDGSGWLPSVANLTLSDRGRGGVLFDDSRTGTANLYPQTYYLLVDQPNALFTGYEPGRVYLPDPTRPSLARGTVYRVVSPLPRLRPAPLRLDRADLSDPSSLELPPISERTAALAESIVRDAPTDYDKAVRLEQFLLLNYRYDLRVEPYTPGRDAVDVFLFEDQAGYCSQFATAMAVMARSVGLPARVAVGYLPGEFDPMTGAYRVRAGDAHAWVEIRMRTSGWVPFDPTPRPDAPQFIGAGGSGTLGTFGLLDLMGSGFTGAISPFGGDWFPGMPAISGVGWLVMLSGSTAAGVAAAIFFLSRRRRAIEERWQYSSLGGEPRLALLRTYRTMAALLARKGLPRRLPAQSTQEYARLVSGSVSRGMDAVDWLSEAASAAAYDPRPVGDSIAREASEKLALLKRTLRVRARASA